MVNATALVLSSVGVGGLLGAFAKAVLDKRQLKFSKVFDYKERRYQNIVILMWIASHPTDQEFTILKLHRPDLVGADALDRELRAEYYNMMLYASAAVLSSFKTFLDEKNMANSETVVRAMKKDLYL